jgi:hypothetical protein
LPKPRIFISHSEKNREPADYAMRLLAYLGCTPVIAEEIPRSNRTIPDLVNDSMESCDAVIVIVTAEINDSNNSPSQGVLIELGLLKKSEKFKGRYFIIKEESVTLSPMIPDSRYKFSKSNFGPIAEAIIIELTSMGLLRNYYEIKGSDLKIHELMEYLDQLRNLANQKILNPDSFKECVENLVRNTVDRIVQRDN